jgi:hypothetical protein
MGSITNRFHFGMRGRILLDYDMTGRLTDDNTIAHHYRAVSLVANLDRLRTHFECTLDK